MLSDVSIVLVNLEESDVSVMHVKVEKEHVCDVKVELASPMQDYFEDYLCSYDDEIVAWEAQSR